MRRVRIRCLLLVCGQAFAAWQHAPSQGGTVSGRVLNEHNHAVIDALVQFQPSGRVIVAMVSPSVKTDQNGSFSIEKLKFGSYLVEASKVEDGYPDTGYSFYTDDRLEVKLSAEHPSASVVAKIGPKAGMLSGTVSDAGSGAPVNPAFHLWHMEEPNRLEPKRWLDMSAAESFRLLIPPDANIGLEVNVKGYKPWYYPGSSNPSELRPLVVKSGEERTIDIRLQRAELGP